VVTYLTLIDMKIPMNTSDLFTSIREIVTYEILPKSFAESMQFMLMPEMKKNDNPYSDKFKMEDVESQYIFIAMFTNIFLIVLYLLG